MGMVRLTDEAREETTFEGKKDMFLSTLDEEAWQSFLGELNQRLEDNLEAGMEWTRREQRAAREDDWFMEAEAGQRGQLM